MFYISLKGEADNIHGTRDFDRQLWTEYEPTGLPGTHVKMNREASSDSDRRYANSVEFDTFCHEGYQVHTLNSY